MEKTHDPVLLSEITDLLNLRANSNAIDCTLGLGGHALEILRRTAPKGKLLAFDQDEENLKAAKNRLKEFSDRVIFINRNFEYLEEEVKERKFGPVNAILFDLGLSSPHVDDPERGFSYREDGPLDMRFDLSTKRTAADVVNKVSEEKLYEILRDLGEEPRARSIARKIVAARRSKPITRTQELVDIIGTTLISIKGKLIKPKIHPATRTFQALRIYLNRELEVLENALHQAIKILSPQGRIAVISYHSLEDRIVKNIFKYYSQDCICPKELPVCQCNFQKKLYLLTKKPIIPSGIEVQGNPRSRSAKLRAATRL